jgi:hypothetical protein
VRRTAFGAPDEHEVDSDAIAISEGDIGCNSFAPNDFLSHANEAVNPGRSSAQEVICVYQSLMGYKERFVPHEKTA